MLEAEAETSDKRLTHLKATICVLKHDRLVNEDLVNMLKASFDNQLVADLLKNEVANGSKDRKGSIYSDEVKRLSHSELLLPKSLLLFGKELCTPKQNLNQGLDKKCSM